MKTVTARSMFALLSALLFAVSFAACGSGGGGTESGPPDLPFVRLSNGQAASVVIGQPDFASNSENQGGHADANTIAIPYGNPIVHNGYLYLPDDSNSRVLGFNSIPESNNVDADFVLGQPDFISINAGTGSTEFDQPSQLDSYAGMLFMASYGNNRVLIWNSMPTTSGAPADLVLGQTDMISNGSSCTVGGMYNPETVAAAGGKVVVTDSENNRVLIWNSIPATDGAQPDLVLGQDKFDNCTFNDDDQDRKNDRATARTFNYPAGVWTDGIRLVVADSANNRVLIWNSFPVSNFEPADIVLGQKDFNLTAANDSDGDGATDSPTASTLHFPYDGVHSNGNQLVVADSVNNRVLIWNAFPVSNFQPADVVIGQQSFTTNAPNDRDGDGVTDGPAANTLNYPAGVYITDKQVIVGEVNNHRWLIFNSL